MALDLDEKDGYPHDRDPNGCSLSFPTPEAHSHGEQSRQASFQPQPDTPPLIHSNGSPIGLNGKRVPWTFGYDYHQQDNLRRVFSQVILQLGYNYHYADLRNNLIYAIPKETRNAIANGLKTNLTSKEIAQLPVPKKRKERWSKDLEEEDIEQIRQFARKNLLKGRNDTIAVINKILSSLSPRQIQAIKNRYQVQMNEIAASFPILKAQGRPRIGSSD